MAIRDIKRDNKDKKKMTKLISEKMFEALKSGKYTEDDLNESLLPAI